MSRGSRPRSGFAAALNWPLLCAVIAVGSLAVAIWPWLQWGPAWIIWPAWANYLAAAVFAVLAAGLYARVRSGPAWRARRDLLQAAASRTSGLWLNRDAHQAFSVTTDWPRWFRLWFIVRIPEDSLREPDPGEGEVPLLAEVFGTIPLSYRVLHRDRTILINPVSREIRELPRTRSRLQAARQHRQAVRAGFGFITVPPQEVAEAAAQLNGSVQVMTEEEIS